MKKHIELAKKLKALADRGVGGEKRNAQKILESLLKKHGLSIEDLEQEEVNTFYWKASGIHATLLKQIMGRVRYNMKKYYFPQKVVRQYGLKGNIAADCTNAEYIEIDQMFSIYKRLYDSEIDIFYTAFLTANELLVTPPNPKSDTELTEKEVENLMRANRMAMSIKSETIRKQLQSHHQ